MRDCGILPDDGKKSIRNLQSKLHKLELALNRKKKDAERKRVSRTKFKDKLTEISLANPEVGQQLAKFNRQEAGRPRIETDQKGLLDAIVSIASYGAAADDRRRTEMLKSCKSLDDLQSELLNNGFHLSRTATYLRLQPRNSVSIQGKKHVKTVPVKLTKAQNVLRKKHIAHQTLLLPQSTT